MGRRQRKDNLVLPGPGRKASKVGERRPIGKGFVSRKNYFFLVFLSAVKSSYDFC